MESIFRLAFICILISILPYEMIGQYEMEWSEVYGGPSLDYPFGVISNSPDKIFVVGESSSTGFGDNTDTDSKSIILVLDNSGQPLDTITLALTERSAIFDIIPLEDGTLMGAGVVWEAPDSITTETKYNLWVFKLDQNGNMIWSHDYGGSAFEYLRGFHQISEEEFILTAFSASDDGDVASSEDGAMWVVKINQDGDMIWEKSFGNEWSSLEVSLKLSDGNILLGGDIRSEETNYDVYFVKINTEGEEQWSNTIGGPQGDIFVGATETPDGDIFGMVYLTEGTTVFPDSTSLVKLKGTDGSITSVSVIDDFFWYQTILHTKEESSVNVFSGTNDTFEDKPVSIKSYNTAGELLSYLPFPQGTTADLLTALTPVDDGYIYTANIRGSNNPDLPGEGDFLVVKLLDLNTSTENTDDLLIHNLYPNPSDQYLSITFNQQDWEILEIYNSIGKRVYTKMIDMEENLQINVSNLGTGGYYARLRNKKRMKTIPFIINR